jgi:FtsH-binding integral membrane protein
MSEGYAMEYGTVAADAPALERQAFMRRTYLHVAGAVVAFGGLCALLQVIIPPETAAMLFMNKIGWIVVILAYLAGTWMAESMADPDKPVGVQYLGLGLFIALEAMIFWPLLFIASNFFKPAPGEMHIITQAALLTGALAGGLTTAAFFSGKDYSFLRPFVFIGCWVAFGIALIAMFSGFSLGIFFPLLMIGLMSAAILYETSQVMYHYRSDQHVGAALAIFAAVATMFYWVLRLLMMSNRD